ncbi:hypothetical protein PCL_10258 [Purpureocillium lilacinum]|uniref:Uncharacterized protein n=1 Tax=Purpureocillium lilacinum TaxID=33203 RepID=A0A2U3EFI9_PURLI|nr:hypothetical protein PCL_10258 [Purpureocillium lilacinum]
MLRVMEDGRPSADSYEVLLSSHDPAKQLPTRMLDVAMAGRGMRNSQSASPDCASYPTFASRHADSRVVCAVDGCKIPAAAEVERRDPPSASTRVWLTVIGEARGTSTLIRPGTASAATPASSSMPCRPLPCSALPCPALLACTGVRPVRAEVVRSLRMYVLVVRHGIPFHGLRRVPWLASAGGELDVWDGRGSMLDASLPLSARCTSTPRATSQRAQTQTQIALLSGSGAYMDTSLAMRHSPSVAHTFEYVAVAAAVGCCQWRSTGFASTGANTSHPSSTVIRASEQGEDLYPEERLRLLFQVTPNSSWDQGARFPERAVDVLACSTNVRHGTRRISKRKGGDFGWNRLSAAAARTGLHGWAAVGNTRYRGSRCTHSKQAITRSARLAGASSRGMRVLTGPLAAAAPWDRSRIVLPHGAGASGLEEAAAGGPGGQALQGWLAGQMAGQAFDPAAIGRERLISGHAHGLVVDGGPVRGLAPCCEPCEPRPADEQMLRNTQDTLLNEACQCRNPAALHTSWGAYREYGTAQHSTESCCSTYVCAVIVLCSAVPVWTAAAAAAPSLLAAVMHLSTQHIRWMHVASTSTALEQATAQLALPCLKPHAPEGGCNPDHDDAHFEAHKAVAFRRPSGPGNSQKNESACRRETDSNSINSPDTAVTWTPAEANGHNARGRGGRFDIARSAHPLTPPHRVPTMAATPALLDPVQRVTDGAVASLTTMDYQHYPYSGDLVSHPRKVVVGLICKRKRGRAGKGTIHCEELQAQRTGLSDLTVGKDGGVPSAPQLEADYQTWHRAHHRPVPASHGAMKAVGAMDNINTEYYRISILGWHNLNGIPYLTSSPLVSTPQWALANGQPAPAAASSQPRREEVAGEAGDASVDAELAAQLPRAPQQVAARRAVCLLASCGVVCQQLEVPQRAGIHHSQASSARAPSNSTFNGIALGNKTATQLAPSTRITRRLAQGHHSPLRCHTHTHTHAHASASHLQLPISHHRLLVRKAETPVCQTRHEIQNPCCLQIRPLEKTKQKAPEPTAGQQAQRHRHRTPAPAPETRTQIERGIHRTSNQHLLARSHASRSFEQSRRYDEAFHRNNHSRRAPTGPSRIRGFCPAAARSRKSQSTKRSATTSVCALHVVSTRIPGFASVCPIRPSIHPSIQCIKSPPTRTRPQTPRWPVLVLHNLDAASSAHAGGARHPLTPRSHPLPCSHFHPRTWMGGPASGHPLIRPLRHQPSPAQPGKAKAARESVRASRPDATTSVARLARLARLAQPPGPPARAHRTPLTPVNGTDRPPAAAAQ